MKLEKFNKLFPVIFFLIIIVTNAQTVNLKIIQTSDIHGAIYPYDFT